MKTRPLEYRKQTRAGSEANIHQASFFERRLFYLIGKLSRTPRFKTFRKRAGLCYKRTR